MGIGDVEAARVDLPGGFPTSGVERSTNSGKGVQGKVGARGGVRMQRGFEPTENFGVGFHG